MTQLQGHTLKRKVQNLFAFFRKKTLNTFENQKFIMDSQVDFLNIYVICLCKLLFSV